MQDVDLIVMLTTSSASLDRSPKKNWVENAGELPRYIRKLARAIEKSGKSLSSAIAIAISRCKVWAAGGGNVDADTRAKAAKAIAEWSALKAKNKAKKLVKASRADGSEYIMLTNVGSFNTDTIRAAWHRENRPRDYVADQETVSEDYAYIKELWSDFVIVESREELFKVPYTVKNGAVSFGEKTKVMVSYVKDPSDDLTTNEKGLLSDILVLKG